LKLFGFVFTVIIPRIVENIKKFRKKTGSTMSNLIEENLNQITANNEKNIKNYIDLIQSKINDCLDKILRKIDDFLKERGNLQTTQPQQGNAQIGGIVIDATSNVKYATFTTLNELKDHINNLKDHKKNFEKALDENIRQFDDLCELFIDLLDDIELDITDVMEEITPYIKIIDLEVDAETLLRENKKLIESLKIEINSHRQRNRAKVSKQMQQTERERRIKQVQNSKIKNQDERKKSIATAISLENNEKKRRIAEAATPAATQQPTTLNVSASSQSISNTRKQPVQRSAAQIQSQRNPNPSESG